MRKSVPARRRAILLRLLGGALLATLLPLLSAQAAEVAHRVRFEIDMSAEIASGRFDPARDALGLRGNSAPLDWGRSMLAKPLGPPGRYGLEVGFAAGASGGQPLQYKFRIERGGQGGDDGWERGRNHALQLDRPALTVTREFNAEAAPVALSRVGTIERLAPLDSRQVSPREVQVWLPPGYAAEPQRRYPVLYLHDGQNVFDAAAAGAEWRVDETAQRLVESGAIEPVIIVAVASGPDRFADYTPTEATLPGARLGEANERRTGGGAERYARYLIDELRPSIDARYRTLPGRAAVGGSSLGGLVSLWLVLHHGQHFEAGLVVSPSVWWDQQFMLRDIAALKPTQRGRIWLDMGAREGGPEALAAARRVRDALLSRGWNARDTLRYVEDPNGGHDEASWAGRVEGMLRFLYGR